MKRQGQIVRLIEAAGKLAVRDRATLRKLVERIEVDAATAAKCCTGNKQS